jgi:broad specificity phosphatase PhoE
MRSVLLALLALFVVGDDVPIQAQQDATVVYLVRHAERDEDGTADPPVTPAGRERARLLADMLRDADLTHIHTTDYLRTRSTAEPVAARMGIEPSVYDARDLDGLAARLRATPGRHLVVGHSDTTPALVRALGGDPGTPIPDPEYDRLYILTLTSGGTSTVLIRFGEP